VAGELAGVIGKMKYGAVLGMFLGGCMVFRGQDSDSVLVEYRFADGEVSSRGMLVEGVPSGFWTSFHEDGTRKSEGNWLAGDLVGEWIFYDALGRIQTTLNYAAGRKNGSEQQWDTLGVLLRSLPWAEDTLNGWEIGFDTNGAEIERIPWKTGQKEGIALQYAFDENGESRIVRRMGYREDLLRWVEDINRYDDQGRQTAKWMTFWPNERVRVEGPYERGLREGVFKFFNRNGDLERTETYKRGERVMDAPEAVALDLRKSYHANGEVSRQGPWRENTPMGMHRFFDEGGHLIEVKVFRSGTLHATGMLDSLGRRSGEWTLFWKEGMRKESGSYLDGKRDGDWTFYARDGRIEQEGGYRAGAWHGAWKWYHSDGSLHRDERYRKGKEDGDFVELSINGDTLARGIYERGLKQGLWLEHVNDDRREGLYLDGERDGKWRHYSAEEKLRFEGEYVAGIPTGQHVTFWPNGVRASMGSYEGGLPEGNWRYFDGMGVVRLVRQYRAGRVVKVNGSKTDR